MGWMWIKLGRCESGVERRSKLKWWAIEGSIIIYMRYLWSQLQNSSWFGAVNSTVDLSKFTSITSSKRALLGSHVNWTYPGTQMVQITTKNRRSNTPEPVSTHPTAPRGLHLVLIDSDWWNWICNWCIRFRARLIARRVSSEDPRWGREKKSC